MSGHGAWKRFVPDLIREREGRPLNRSRVYKLASALLATLSVAGCTPTGQAPIESDEGSVAPVVEAPLTRVAFGSCAFQWVEQPIFRTIVAAGPDLYLSLGDAIYGDFDGEKTFDVTPESLREEWGKLAASPDWQYLSENVPVMATWDNHDYGHHSAGEEFQLKEVSKGIFLDFFDEPADSARLRREGIYDAEILGPEGRRVQVILLDTRSFKSPPRLAVRPEGAGGSLGKYAPNDDPDATLLGEAQWGWLEDQLRQPAEVRLIASSGQVVADEKGMDEWGNYPLERQRLFDLIGATGAAGCDPAERQRALRRDLEDRRGPVPALRLHLQRPDPRQQGVPRSAEPVPSGRTVRRPQLRYGGD